MTDRNFNIGLLVGLFGLLATNCTTDTSSTETTSAQDAAVRYERALQGAAISLADAIRIAQEAYPDGVATEAELELEEGVPAFEVEVAFADGTSVEVRIDPETGDILSAEADDDDDHSGPGHDGADDHEGDHDGAGGATNDDDHGDADCAGSVSRAEAVSAAEAATGAHAIEVEFEDCEFEVLVVKDGMLQEVDVGADGSVLGVEAHDSSDGHGDADDDHGDAADAGDDHGDDAATDDAGDDHGDDAATDDAGDDAATDDAADAGDDHGDDAEEPGDDHSGPSDAAEPDDAEESGDDGAGGEHP